MAEHLPTDVSPTTGPEVFLGERGSRIAIAGLLFSVLFVVAWLLLLDSPSFDASDQELFDYYGDPDRRRNSVIAGLYVIPFGGIAFIWFMAALRDRYLHFATRENTILSTAHVVAGALVVTSLFTIAGVELAVSWLGEAGSSFDADGARSVLALGEALSDIMALRSAAVFVGVSATRAMRSGIFPRAYGVLSMITAVALLLVYEAVPGVALTFPAWVAGSSVLILVRRRAAQNAEA
jgi:hypothetical protein